MTHSMSLELSVEATTSSEKIIHSMQTDKRHRREQAHNARRKYAIRASYLMFSTYMLDRARCKTGAIQKESAA